MRQDHEQGTPQGLDRQHNNWKAVRLVRTKGEMYSCQTMMMPHGMHARLISQPGSPGALGPFAFESCNCPQAYAPPRNEPFVSPQLSTRQLAQASEAECPMHSTKTAYNNTHFMSQVHLAVPHLKTSALSMYSMMSGLYFLKAACIWLSSRAFFPATAAPGCRPGVSMNLTLTPHTSPVTSLMPWVPSLYASVGAASLLHHKESGFVSRY